MAADADDSITYSKECKICNHKRRFAIEDMIRNDVSYRDIVKKYSSLNIENISRHWKAHMAKPIRAKTEMILDAEAVKRRDSIVELNKVMDDIDEVMGQVKKRITDNEVDDIEKSANAYRGLAQTKVSAIKVNMKLMGDSQEERSNISLSKAIMEIRKDLQTKKKEVLEVQFPPAPPKDDET